MTSTKSPEYKRGARSKPRLWMLRAAASRGANLAFRVADSLIPKRKRRVALGCDKGVKFSGNPRALFEFMAASPEWDAYWLTNSDALINELSPAFPGRVVKAWSLKGLWLGLSANWLCISHSPYDLGPMAYLRGRRFMYMTHGTPLKTMGYAKAYADPAVVSVAGNCRTLTCCSDFEAKLWERAYRIDDSQIWVTGVARNDRLFAVDESVRAAIPKTGGKTILYAPTYRETGRLKQYLPVPDLDGAALVALLDKYDATLLIRPHYYEWDAAIATISQIGSDRVRAADEKVVPDVNNLLPLVDVLITDYSSIYVDYLLLDRPIIFTPYDADQYAGDRGFMIDYDSHTPGAKACEGGEFLLALERELRGEDPLAAVRAEARNLFHRYPDNQSAKRIAERMAQ